MKKLIVTAAIASLVGGASLVWAEPAHQAMPMAGMPMQGGKHHALHGHHHKMHCQHGSGGMHGMSGDHGMMGMDGMDHEHMRQMHDHMGNGGQMGGGMMGDMAPSVTPTSAPTPAPVAPK
jgi:hypothetical protein